jgi:Beta-ketoacyl synthase, N-terminal domain
MSMLVFVESVGLLGPGLAGWEASRPVLQGAAAHVEDDVALPPPELLPAAERRRTGLPVRLALRAGLDALERSARRNEAVPSVFTSSGADGQVIHDICVSLASAERQVSPTRFHNSVHNAPAGYWSIALRSHAPSTSLCCYDWSFAAGLVEACTQCIGDAQPVLLVSYDLPYPEPLHHSRPVTGTLGVALLLAPDATGGALARLDLSIEANGPVVTRAEPPALEALRTGNPTGRALPLLQNLAGPRAGTVVLEYLNGGLVINVTHDGLP